MEGGWWEWEPTPGDQGREMILPLCSEIIDRGEIKTKYLTQDAAEVLTMFDNWKRTGLLPYSGGTWEQPAVMMDILMALDYERDMRHNKQTAERKSGKR